MIKKALNILSIDWDYYINASENIRADYFPDSGNENLGQDLRNIIWTSLYATSKNTNNDISAISSKNDAVNYTKKIIQSHVADNCTFWIADSHKWAFNAINKIAEKSKCNSLNLTNVDFHHDLFDIKDFQKNQHNELHCGNWLSHIINRYEGYFTWVKQDDSYIEKNYEYAKSKYNIVNTNDISVINNYAWDLVYICRSGMWSPPHLDVDFINAFGWIPDSGKHCVVEQDIFIPRYTDDMKEDIIQHNLMQKEIMNAYKL